MENKGRVILFVEDNPGDARLLLEMLKEIPMTSYKAIVAESMSDAFSNIDDYKFDIIILDLNLPDSKGLSTLDKMIIKIGGSVPVIVMTGLNDEKTGITAIEHGADDYLVKGEVNSSQLLRSIRYSVERNKIARKLRKSEEQGRAIIDNLPGGIIHIFDRDFRYLYNAGEALEKVGLTNEMLVGKTIYDFLTPGLAEVAADRYRLVLAGETVHFEGEFGDKTFLITAAPLFDEKGSVEKILVLSIDITDRKHAEKKLFESEEKYRTFINATDDIAFLKDDRFRYIMTNKNHAALLGKKSEEIIGKTDFELLPLDTAVQCSESDKLAISGNTTVISEETFGDRIYETRKFPVKLKDEKIGVGSFIRDVTAIKIAAVAIEKAAQEWRVTFDSIDDVIWLLDPDFKILRANAASEKMLGISPAELIGKNCWNVVHGTDKPVDRCPVLKVKKSLKPEKSLMQLKDRWVNITVYPVLGDNSELTRIVHIIEDVTVKKILEDNLILRSTAMKNAANGIVITDIEGDIIWLNPAFEKLTGYSSEEIVGHNPREIIKSGKHSVEFYRKMWSTINSGNVWSGEITNRRKNGTLYTEEMTIAPVKNSNGEIKNFIAIKQDITDKKYAIELLNVRFELINFSMNHTQEEILVKALDEIENFTSSSIGFFHFLEDDQVTLSLQAWSTQTLLKFCKTDGRGMHYNLADAGVWADCIREKRVLIHNDYMSLPRRKGLPEGHAGIVREMVIPIMRNDKIKAIIGFGNKINDYTNEDISVATYISDIVWDMVERKRTEESLKKLNVDLEIKVADRTEELIKINKELESFSYSVSHDLRAPLRHIIGFIELLRVETKGILNQKSLHQIDVIEESAKRMNQLIEDLLSYSRMARSAFSRQTIDMESLAGDVLEEYSAEIQSGKISVDLNHLPRVTGDRAMIRIVFVNLISNAIKFTGKTERPAIEIGFKTIDNKDTFYVRDNGSGFNMKYADKLFGVFQRMHSHRDFHGTGIGLALVKSIIERHGGQIWAESEPDKGACFYFTLTADQVSD